MWPFTKTQPVERLPLPAKVTDEMVSAAAHTMLGDMWSGGADVIGLKQSRSAWWHDVKRGVMAAIKNAPSIPAVNIGPLQEVNLQHDDPHSFNAARRRMIEWINGRGTYTSLEELQSDVERSLR